MAAALNWAKVLFAVRGAVYTLAIVTLFYLPTWWLIPGEHSIARWGVWMLGWTGAFVVQFFSEWYRGTWR